jgi:hypothetical protein
MIYIDIMQENKTRMSSAAIKCMDLQLDVLIQSKPLISIEKSGKNIFF